MASERRTRRRRAGEAGERGAAAGPGLDRARGTGAAERDADRDLPCVGRPRGEPDDERFGQTADWVDCAAWGAKAAQTASRWRAGDVVEVEGALRRGSTGAAAGTSTRLEVEVLSGRLVTRAERGPPAAPAAGADPWLGSGDAGSEP